MKIYSQSTIDLVKAERDALLQHILSAVGYTMDQKSKEFIQGILERNATRLLSVDEYQVRSSSSNDSGVGTETVTVGVSSFNPETGETVEYRSVEQACIRMKTRRDRIENAVRTGGKHLKLYWMVRD